jgi:hypothetical protein
MLEIVIRSGILVYFSIILFRERQAVLASLYLALFFLTGFFGTISYENIRIEGLINSVNIVAIILLWALFYSYSRSRVVFKSPKLLFFFTLVYFAYGLLVLLNSEGVFTGRFLSNFKDAFYSLQFILIIIVYKVFLTVPLTKVEKLLKFIIFATIMNSILYILNSFGFSVIAMQDHYSETDSMVRNFKGFPVFISFIFGIIYLQLRRNFTLKNFVLILILLFTVYQSHTRSWIIGFSILILYFEILRMSTVKMVLSLILLMIATLLWIVTDFTFTGSIFGSNRMSEIFQFKSILDITNVSIRVDAFKDILISLSDNNVFGNGFSDKYKDLFTGDIFWANILHSSGYIGALIFLAIIVLMIKTLTRSGSYISNAAIGSLGYALIISSTGSVVFMQQGIAIIFIWAFGYYYKNLKKI